MLNRKAIETLASRVSATVAETPRNAARDKAVKLAETAIAKMPKNILATVTALVSAICAVAFHKFNNPYVSKDGKKSTVVHKTLDTITEGMNLSATLRKIVALATQSADKTGDSIRGMESELQNLAYAVGREIVLQIAGDTFADIGGLHWTFYGGLTIGELPKMGRTAKAKPTIPQSDIGNKLMEMSE